MPRPTIISGQMLGQSAVTPAAAMIARLAIMSLRAGEKCGPGQTARDIAHPGQQQRAGRVDGEGGEAGEREKRGLRHQRRGGEELVRQGHEERNRGEQQDTGKRITQPRPRQGREEHRRQHQDAHRRVFEKIDAVGEQRDGADGKGDDEASTAKRVTPSPMTSHSVGRSRLSAPDGSAGASGNLPKFRPRLRKAPADPHRRDLDREARASVSTATPQSVAGRRRFEPPPGTFLT